MDSFFMTHGRILAWTLDGMLNAHIFLLVTDCRTPEGIIITNEYKYLHLILIMQGKMKQYTIVDAQFYT